MASEVEEPRSPNQRWGAVPRAGAHLVGAAGLDARVDFPAARECRREGEFLHALHRRSRFARARVCGGGVQSRL